MPQSSHPLSSPSLPTFSLSQHIRPPCPSLSPRVCSNECPLSASGMPSNHLILCCPLLLLSSVFPNIRIFSSEFLCIRWPKYWSFNFSISPSNEYSALISFRIHWFVLLAVQETLNSLLQHHSSKVSVLQHSACFMVQLSHLYMTTGKHSFDCPVLGQESDVSAF